MNFWQIAFPTFTGAFIAFIFSIILFHLTNKWSKDAQRKSLEENLIKEFEFNEHFLAKIKEDVKKVIEKVTVDDHNVYQYLKYVNYQRLFTQNYFQQGLLYKKLSPDDINLLDNILRHMDQPGERYINNIISRWNAGEFTQQEALNKLSFERDSLEEFLKNLIMIKEKII